MDYPEIPRWARDPLANCLEYIRDLSEMLRVSTIAISATQILPKLIDFVVNKLPNVKTLSPNDRKFVESCPTLKMQVGENVLTKGIKFLNYMEPAVLYLSKIQLRIYEAFGATREQLQGTPITELNFKKDFPKTKSI